MRAIIAVDAQSIAEVASSLTDFGDRYTNRLFTQSEIESCAAVPERAASLFAACFAAKEAVLKLLDLRGEMPPWTSIEVSRGPSGPPQIHLHDAAARVASQQGVTSLALSISLTGTLATAVVTGDVRRG